MAAPAITVDDTPLIITNWGCPFAHRMTLAQVHKGRKFNSTLGVSEKTGENTVREVEIDLANKPSWLTQYSPLGKVPAVTYKEGDKAQVLYESLVLIQWVDEYFDGPALLPSSPAERALARIIIARYDSSLVPSFFGALRASTKEQFQEAWAKLTSELTWLEEHADPKGPYLLGSSPTLVDAAVAPTLLRQVFLKHWRKVDMLAKFPRLSAFHDFYRRLPEVESVLRTPNNGVGYDAWAGEIYKSAGKFAGGEVLDFSDAV